MNNRVWVTLAVIIVILLGAGAFAAYKQSHPNSLVDISPTSQPSNQPAATTAAANQMMSLKDLWNAGTSQKCTFSENGATGTVYISQGKVRGDTQTAVNGQMTTSHMVMDGKNVYVWIEGQTQGYKMSVDSIDKENLATSSSNVDLNKKYPVNCQPASIEASEFDLPAAIKFQDMSSMMQGAVKASGSAGASVDTKSIQCSACNSLLGDARDQCRKALSCQ